MWGSWPLLTVSMDDRLVFTLQKLYTFTIARVPHVAQVCKALKHYQGECLGVHYEAFTKASKKDQQPARVTVQGKP
jgi:hypothetical protein